MRIKKGSKLIAAIIAVFSFTTIAYLSCTRNGAQLNTCNYYVCQNGGYCHRDTVTKLVGCLCPTGYEGANCSVIAVSKYVGTWEMKQVITGSDSLVFQHDTSHYLVMIKKTATPTTFFIDNFSANPNYNNITCTMDSIDSHNFIIDTFSSFHLMYENYHLVVGGGYITANDSFIQANLITKHLSATSNWIHDTFLLQMTRHNF